MVMCLKYEGYGDLTILVISIILSILIICKNGSNVINTR